MLKFNKIQCALFTFLALIPLLASARNTFTVNSEPINPACIALINGSEADFPFVYELNINRCQKANASAMGGSGKMFYVYNHQHYAYKVIGVTKNHIFIIMTTQSGGGSGIFQDVLLLRLCAKHVFTYDIPHHKLVAKPYMALQYLGRLGGGDRQTGSFRQLKVVGNHVIGLLTSPKNPANVKAYPDQKIDIDLSQISKR